MSNSNTLQSNQSSQPLQGAAERPNNALTALIRAPIVFVHAHLFAISIIAFGLFAPEEETAATTTVPGGGTTLTTTAITDDTTETTAGDTTATTQGTDPTGTTVALPDEDDLTIEPSAWIQIRGKGRKQRSVPLWPETAAQLKRWLHQYPRASDQPLFPNRSGGQLTRVGLTERLKLAAQKAALHDPELANQRVFPHLVRHSTAMHMLQAGVDITVIALWLGHESPATTHRYLEADLAMKERALQSVQPPSTGILRLKPEDPILEFLQSL